MDTLDRLKLQKLREKIVQDLDVQYIMDHLLAKFVITTEDRQIIMSEQSKRDQARHLLDLLPKRGPMAFSIFLNSLKKDYSWLYSDLSSDLTADNQVDMNSEHGFYDAIVLGGLPRYPPHNVEREGKLTEIRQHLKKLKKDNYVVLHGMTGSGKSCLAAAAVQHKDLLMNTFKGLVLWLSVSDAKTDNLLSFMIHLWQKLQFHSGFYFGDLDIKNQMTSVEEAKQVLVRYFLTERLREGLLILDDVTSSDVISAFDLRCKILVTTKDIEVMRNVSERNKHLIKTGGGFTEEESLSLFAKSIDVPVDHLPPQAKKIHKLCKGVPIIIALIGGQLEDNRWDTQHNQGRWDYYISILKEKQFGRIKHPRLFQQANPLHAIGKMVDNLPPDMGGYYEDFALFIEDVNITSEVLQTLWALKSKYEVEDIMSYFTKKSLTVAKWNEQIGSCVYGVHDLLLSYLKSKLTDEKKVALHRKLLAAYSQLCAGQYANLPDDNYIFYYIGYHLHEAHEWGMYQKLFLNLEFIEAKLRVTGPGDLLVDFSKYKNYIIGEDKTVSSQVDDIVNFIKSFGLDLYKLRDLDIIQCGLQERRSSFVYKRALEIAQSRHDKLYLEFLFDQDIPSQPQTLSLREEVFSACFTPDRNKILIASENGTIYLWELDYMRMMFAFSGHKQRVVHMEISADRKHFLSRSIDGAVKVWDLVSPLCMSDYQEECDRLGHAYHMSASYKEQIGWHNMFSEENPDNSLKTFGSHDVHIHKATFARNSEEILTCSENYFIKILKWKTNEVRLTLDVRSSKQKCISSCTFSHEDAFILSSDNLVLCIYSSKTGDIVSSVSNPGQIIAIFSIPDFNNIMIAVTEVEFKIWKWKDIIENRSVISNHSVNKPVRFMSAGSLRNKSDCYVCAAMSQDSQLLVTATSNHTISVCRVGKANIITEYRDHGRLIHCLDTFQADNFHLLLSGSGDRTLKIWQLDQAGTKHSIHLLASLDATWDSHSLESSIPLLAVRDTENRLQVLRGNQKVAESLVESSKITACLLTASGLLAVYGCADGQVKRFDVATKQCEVTMTLKKEVSYLQLLQNKGFVLVAAGDSDSLKMWRGTGEVLTNKNHISQVVQSFLFPGNKHLLSCSEDASVMLWDTVSGRMVQVLAGRMEKARISAADMNDSRDLLVLGDMHSCFHIASLQLSRDSPFVELKGLKTLVTEDAVHTCQLSPDAQLLALGLASGAIIVKDVVEFTEIGKLKLHSSQICNMIFASVHIHQNHSSMLLVSVGEHIAWWNVSTLLEGFHQKHHQRSLHLHPAGNYMTLVKGKETVSNEVWLDKKGKKEKPELLGCVKLVGSHAQHISASPDFSAFVTMDLKGNVYLMQVLQKTLHLF